MIPPWTEEQNELLKRLWAAGASAGQIAAQPEFAGRTRNAVIGRLHRLGLDGTTRAKSGAPRAIGGSLSAVTPREKRQTRSQASYGAGPPRLIPKSRQVAPVDAPLVIGDRIGCQFIAADTDLGSAPKCGRPRVTVAGRDSPYCGEHHAMCYERWAGAKQSRLTPGRIGAK